MRDLIDDASFLDSLDERIASAIISDRQSQSIFALDDLNLLRSALSVRKDEVVEANLTAEQLRHVDFV